MAMDEREAWARAGAMKMVGLLMNHIKEGEEGAAYEKLAQAMIKGNVVVSFLNEGETVTGKASGSLGEIAQYDPLRQQVWGAIGG